MADDVEVDDREAIICSEMYTFFLSSYSLLSLFVIPSEAAG